MHISELVFKRKKTFYFFLVAILIGGIFSFNKLSKLEDPEITLMVANVITVLPGSIGTRCRNEGNQCIGR